MVGSMRIRAEEGYIPLSKQPACKDFDGRCLFLRETERVDLDAAPPRKQRVQRRLIICKFPVSIYMREDNALRFGIRSSSQIQNPPDEIQNIPASAARVELQQHVSGVAEQRVILALHLLQNRFGRFCRAVDFASGIQRKRASLLCPFLLKQLQALPVSIVTPIKAVRRAGDVPDTLIGFHMKHLQRHRHIPRAVIDARNDVAVQIDGLQHVLVPRPFSQKLRQRLARRHVPERISETVEPIIDVEERAMTICFGMDDHAIDAAKPAKNVQLFLRTGLPPEAQGHVCLTAAEPLHVLCRNGEVQHEAQILRRQRLHAAQSIRCAERFFVLRPFIRRFMRGIRRIHKRPAQRFDVLRLSQTGKPAVGNPLHAV